ncbi:cytochrome P450 [Pseudahrensia aquimaris]|uniref:Cytochrome P450 n=1 Tax=Pseudahrensia aquimaris TaxID=744461 RepID=A0ABW3FC90_9HYPH
MPNATNTAPIDTQAHLLRPSKFADGRTRDWSLFVFFRILSEREMKRSAQLVENLIAAKDAGIADHHARALLSEMRKPRRMNESKAEAYLIEQMAQMGQIIPSNDAPAKAFLAWLGLVAKADLATLLNTISDVLKPLGARRSKALPGKMASDVTARLSDAKRLLGEHAGNGEALQKTLKTLAAFAKGAASPEGVDALHALFGKDPLKAGLTALDGGLPTVIAYEMLRQMKVANASDTISKSAGVAHAEADTDTRLAAIKEGKSAEVDSVPSNYAFTAAGLEALKLDQNTLRSFPDVFLEGMAARADRLGDTGANAPNHWQGELGQKSVHGYFTGGFQIGGEGMPSQEIQWKRLREDIADFNAAASGNGEALRTMINGLFRLIGLEIVHLEVGQDPYTVADDGSVVREKFRMEHFGFRDGISQPFVDMKLGAPPAGGGTPGRNKSWKPVAAGEIVLDQPNEDGRLAKQPAHPDLRRGGTFLVFRKLEQDVIGLRNFLKSQKPDQPDAQKKLVSQMMGRWPNGCSLVHEPDNEGDASDPRLLNNFTFRDDDPEGRRCPLGSHVRRSNPRDLGGNDDVRRHRILRRGISYGGPFVPQGANAVEEKRGMLFICANARIDLQFEVVQSKWINGGEFSGQAGLAKCPITGNNGSDVQDAFLEPGAAAPISRVPRFVTTKGGDYFFAPGVATLAQIASGEKFALKPEELPYDGAGFGAAKTKTLFDPERLQDWARAMIAGKTPIVRVPMPAAPINLADEEPGNDNFILEDALMPKSVVFLAKHADAKAVISGVDKARDPLFSVTQYQEAGRRLLRGHDLLIGTQKGDDTEADRERLTDMLNTAWGLLTTKGNAHARIEAITKRELENALASAASTGEIDLVDDLAVRTSYAIVSEVFGTPGPDHLTELAMSLPFARQHIGQVYPDWLETLDRTMPANRGMRTMQIWSILLLLDIVGNVPQVKALKALGNQAAAEMFGHFDVLLAKASQNMPLDFGNDPGDRPLTLLDCLLLIAPQIMAKYKRTRADYLNDVRGLLLELVGSPVATIPVNFAAMMQESVKLNLDLPHLISMLQSKPLFKGDASVSGINRFIYEILRINPTVRLIMRQAMQDTVLPSGGKVKKDEWVAAIMAAANLDIAAFPNSQEFSLHPFDQGAKRDYENYMLFGAPGGGRECWGRDRLALLVMSECLKAAARLKGMRAIAGPEGEVQTFLRMARGYKVRFNEVLPQRHH